MLSPVACRSLRTLLMDGFECLPVRCSAPAPAPFLLHRLLHLSVHHCSANPRRPGSKNLPFCHRSSGFCSFSYRPFPSRNNVARAAVRPGVAKRIAYLKSKLEEQGIGYGNGKPGTYWRNLCPKFTFLDCVSSPYSTLWEKGDYLLPSGGDGPSSIPALETRERTPNVGSSDTVTLPNWKRIRVPS
ncbi:hypothetical protein BHM03_00003130 [Ensete ventricosum]|nr:hypothetical protein BHM03_00003130 [Ensete ventricosum]